MVVLVTGAKGQLGQSLQFIAKNYPFVDFRFCDSKTLDITDLENVKQVFKEYKPNFCVNTAAYTAVDKAETEPEKAFAINVTGAKNLAEVCKKFDTTLIHISTDFVFDGNYENLSPRAQSRGYLETDQTNPQSVYGQTKLDGEKVIQTILEKYIIIRTSWVYSQFGNNFLKTMLRLGSERETLSVVNDQIGTPTNAVDLADAIMKIISLKFEERSGKREDGSLKKEEARRKMEELIPEEQYTSQFQTPCSQLRSSNSQLLTPNFGLYNFSNLGQCSWYDFAKKIFQIQNINIDLKPIPSVSYPTPAKRPKYSVLDKSKIINTFGLEIKTWEESLKTVFVN
jgi:dTDP-4-dehydrorhamnose reductase